MVEPNVYTTINCPLPNCNTILTNAPKTETIDPTLEFNLATLIINHLLTHLETVTKSKHIVLQQEEAEALEQKGLRQALDITAKATDTQTAAMIIMGLLDMKEVRTRLQPADPNKTQTIDVPYEINEDGEGKVKEEDEVMVYD